MRYSTVCIIVTWTLLLNVILSGVWDQSLWLIFHVLFMCCLCAVYVPCAVYVSGKLSEAQSVRWSAGWSSCLVLGVIVDPLLRLMQSVGRIQFSVVLGWAPHILASCHRGPSFSSLRPPTLPLVFLAPSSSHQWCRVLLLLGIWLLPLPYLSCLWSENSLF